MFLSTVNDDDYDIDLDNDIQLIEAIEDSVNDQNMGMKTLFYVFVLSLTIKFIYKFTISVSHESVLSTDEIIISWKIPTAELVICPS